MRTGAKPAVPRCDRLRCRSRRQLPASPLDSAYACARVCVRGVTYAYACTCAYAYAYAYACLHVCMLDVAHVCVVWISWVAVPAIPVRVSRAWNAQVSRCICYVGLLPNWGGIPNDLSRSRPVAWSGMCHADRIVDPSRAQHVHTHGCGRGWRPGRVRHRRRSRAPDAYGTRVRTL